MDRICLNCQQEVLTQYCGHCGQKASTHRYSLKHFVEHDLVHGIWHVDKGILRTLKDLFTTPGHSVRAFVLGKRSNYFNFVTLILTLAAVSAVLAVYSHFDLLSTLPKESREALNGFQKFVTQYPKIVLVIAIPVYSIFSYVWFRKAKFNYSEHLVLNSYRAAGEMVIGIVFVLVTIIYRDPQGLTNIYYVTTVITMIYPIWFYIQFFSQAGYSKKALFLRSIMVPVTYLLLSFLIGIFWAIFNNNPH